MKINFIASFDRFFFFWRQSRDESSDFPFILLWKQKSTYLVICRMKFSNQQSDAARANFQSIMLMKVIYRVHNASFSILNLSMRYVEINRRIQHPSAIWLFQLNNQTKLYYLNFWIRLGYILLNLFTTFLLRWLFLILFWFLLILWFAIWQISTLSGVSIRLTTTSSISEVVFLLISRTFNWA